MNDLENCFSFIFQTDEKGNANLWWGSKGTLNIYIASWQFFLKNFLIMQLKDTVLGPAFGINKHIDIQNINRYIGALENIFMSFSSALLRAKTVF